MSDLSGRVALVTGSGSGIGKATARAMAQRGAIIITNDISGDYAEDALAEIREETGCEGMSFTSDVTDAEQVTEMVKQVIDKFGKIDILVNNAGTTRDNLIMRMSEDEYDFIMRTNLKSAWICSKAVIRPMMKKRYGRIVNMSSASGLMGQAGQTNYSASKAGMIGMTKALAREVASRNITVNAVAPGFVQTALTEKMPAEILEQLLAYIPIGRQGTVDDITHAVLFLVAEEASYITGQVLSVDGGLVMS
ncbi:MAG: 3-oxoacyl-[acyl-carrier-protein] reductase [Anaerolineae bacterium]|nr:3-oxoacyl-[acyl-carrier-protein] reductase [Anaerolineae bacterium]